VPQCRLKWHYRSAHESLITFSNVSFYGADLYTLPSVHTGTDGIGQQLEYVQDGMYEGKELNQAEARRVVDAVVAFAKEQAERTARGGSALSLGVGTFNLRQQLAIQDELEQRRRVDPSIEPFFARREEGGLFVKNLENIQGDERALIFLSVTYPGDREVRVRYNFGPLNGENGWRRLNVLTTRARRMMRVFSSMRGDEINAFPVLYMPDGGLAEDFLHVAATIDSLIARKAIAPVVVVGIENTQRRRDMTGPTTVAADSTIAPRVGGSAAFRRLPRDELMPEVRNRYRTTDVTAIVGESLAGLFIVETFLLEPRLFRRYIALDPSLWWNGGELVRTADRRLRSLDARGRTLYLASSREPGIASEAARLAAALERHAPTGLSWRYEPRPDLEHGTIYRGASPGAFAAVLR
jgi:predicted alpha/beta superfamily hydrolase